MEVIELKTNTNIMVKKSHEMVRDSRYKLSEMALKTLAVLISQIHTKDEDFKSYAIKIDDFKAMSNVKTNEVFKYVNTMTNELMQNPFWIGTAKYNWVIKADYKKGLNVVEFQIHPDLKGMLLDLQNKFLRYDIKNIMVLKSNYIIRLYELCKEQLGYQQTRDKKGFITFSIKIDEFKKMFQTPTTYQFSSHIKKRILDVAVKEFKEKTDIEMTYTAKKLGRSFDEIIFKIKENGKGSADINSERVVFISHIRDKYTNQLLLQARDNDTQKVMDISVSEKGKLYDKKTGKDFKAERSNEIWDVLYEMSKKGTLECLTKNTLFN